MQEFNGKVAVITGAAEGIGRGMAERFARAGMKVVLVDINRDLLSRAAESLRDAGATVLEVIADVGDYEQVKGVARAAYDAFAAVHVLCNNAGLVSLFEPIWTIPMDEWQRVLAVNFNGVLNGVHVFAPLMHQQGDEGHIINTASMAGIGSRGGHSPYVVTKHAVIALSESLHHDLGQIGSRIKASVLCPGPVLTKLVPASLVTEEMMSPADVAEIVLEAIRDERFYVFTHPAETRDRVRVQAMDMLLDRPPTSSRRVVPSNDAQL